MLHHKCSTGKLCQLFIVVKLLTFCSLPGFAGDFLCLWWKGFITQFPNVGKFYVLDCINNLCCVKLHQHVPFVVLSCIIVAYNILIKLMVLKRNLGKMLEIVVIGDKVCKKYTRK